MSEEEQPSKKLKELFTGTSLNGYIERGRVKELTEFMEKGESDPDPPAAVVRVWNKLMPRVSEGTRGEMCHALYDVASEAVDEAINALKQKDYDTAHSLCIELDEVIKRFEEGAMCAVALKPIPAGVA